MIRTAILNWARARPPHFVIGGHDNPYMLRWWLTPWSRCYRDLPAGHKKTLWQEFVTRLPGVYVHHFLRSDDDRALHTHPWLFNCSWLLQGWYREHTPGRVVERSAGDWKFRWGGAAHRIELLTLADFIATQPNNRRPISCWTLFITGPRVRDWGFLCPQGFVNWRTFTAPHDKGAVGRGCD